jgi:hypothetical protein
MYEYALTPSLSVSFQRYPYPAAGFVTALATSWGALPFLATAPGRLVLPCPDEEAFWIGLVPSPAGHQYRLRGLVSTTSGDRVDALTGAPADDPDPVGIDDLLQPPRHGVPGIFRGDGSWWAFARHSHETPAPACREIELRCRSAGAAVPVNKSSGPGRQHAGPRCPSSPPEPGPGKSSLSVEAGGTSSVRVAVVAPEYFHVLSGSRVPPLDESNRYGGWRLP